MLTIKPANQIRTTDQNKIKSVIDSIEMEVWKTKQSQYTSGKHCSLPTNYGTLNQSEKDELNIILSRGGYQIKQIHDKGQDRTWKRVEWN